MQKYILSIDQGTTSTRVLLVDKNGKVCYTVSKLIKQYYRQPGFVEQDANEIFLSVLECVSQLLIEYTIVIGQIEAIGITNQRETTVLWDRKSAEPLCNAIVWQSRQSAEICDRLKNDGFEKLIHNKTGLLIDPYFSATKIMWMMEHVPNIRLKMEKDEVAFGTIDSWLIYKLTNSLHITDISNASRTMMFNIHTSEWDEELLTIYGISKKILPQVKSNSQCYGYTDSGMFFGAKIPICSSIGDQQAALFGQCCFDVGLAKNTYGTGSFMLVNTGQECILSDKGLLTTIAWQLDDKVTYALEGSTFVTGSAINWLKDNMQMIKTPEQSQTLAMSVKNNGGVYFVPAFVGLGTPYWDNEARGMILGLSRGSQKAHIVRACLEAIAFQTKDVVNTMTENTSFKIKQLNVDGGMTKNHFLLQFQADILGTTVIKASVDESTALGAAYLAGLACGFYESLEQIASFYTHSIAFNPSMSDTKRSTLYSNWKMAVQASIGFKPVEID